MIRFVIEPKVTYSCDVAVIGGGTAGVFAAVSASRCGARVILVEKSSVLGGTVTSGGVNFPGLFFAWGKQIISGPCWEAIERTVQLGGATLPEITYKPSKHWKEQILIDSFVYRSVLWDMCNESNVEVLLSTMVSAVNESDDGASVLLTGKEGFFAINAGVLIDATGDANAASVAGFETVKSAVQQPATPQNRISGYDFDKIDLDMLRSRFKDDSLPEHITADKVIACLKNGKFDIHVPCADAHTSMGRTRVERDAMGIISRLYRFCRSISGLEGLRVESYAAETGVRETVRIIGEETLTAEDYISGKCFDNAVCYAFYPIDLHVADGIKQRFFDEGKVGTIPYGALIPKGAKRMLCAGRCASSDTDANSAIRVQAPCMAMGQAAGCAAAIASRQSLTVKDVPFSALTEALRWIGAIVPERQ